MLDRLRPLVLEQMGLSQALRQQIMSWQATYPHITWSLDMPQNFDDPAEALSLTLYRAVQESGINVVRHAQASAIEVRLGRQPVCGTGHTTMPDAAGSVFLSVHDDGRGLPDNFRCGFGLLGLTERVRQLRGTLAIRNMHPGVAIDVTIPEEAQQATAELEHADSID
jgi:two-component system sensor histidine kinase UhpB